MKTNRIPVLTAFLCFALIPLQASTEAFEQLLLPYFDVQTALANDDFHQVCVTATQLAMNAKFQEAPTAERAEAIRTAAREIAFSENITAARNHFATLSKQVIALVQENDSQSDYSIVRMHCSMALENKGADWLQNSSQTANPYFGASMLSCGSKVAQLSEGEVLATIQPVKAAASACCSSDASSAIPTSANASCCATPAIQ